MRIWIQGSPVGRTLPSITAVEIQAAWDDSKVKPGLPGVVPLPVQSGRAAVLSGDDLQPQLLPVGRFSREERPSRGQPEAASTLVAS